MPLPRPTRRRPAVTPRRLFLVCRRPPVSGRLSVWRPPPVGRWLLACALLLLGGAVPARAAPGSAGRPADAPGSFHGARPADPPGSAGTAQPRGSFRWPLDGTPRVTRPFAPPLTPYGPGHRGVDLAAAPGAIVRTAGPGVVSFAGSVAGRGVVVVRHDDGLRTTYEPVVARVRAGTAVRAGDPLGILAAGHPGCPAAACLHWGLLRGSVYLDPLALLGLGRVRLWPLEPGDVAVAVFAEASLSRASRPELRRALRPGRGGPWPARAPPDVGPARGLRARDRHAATGTRTSRRRASAPTPDRRRQARYATASVRSGVPASASRPAGVGRK
jgi:hypothetical protein